EGPPSVSELRGRFFAYVLGTALLALAAAATLFAGYALLLGEPTRGFALVVLAALPSGIVLRGLGSPNAEPSRREALAGVLVTWLLMPALSGVPYALTDGVSLVDAFFGGVSASTPPAATTTTALLARPTSLMLGGALTSGWGASASWCCSWRCSRSWRSRGGSCSSPSSPAPARSAWRRACAAPPPWWCRSTPASRRWRWWRSCSRACRRSTRWRTPSPASRRAASPPPRPA